MGKVNEFATSATEKVESFVESNPEATLGIVYALGLVVSIPLGLLCCKIMGEAQGRGFASGFLKEAGVQIGYPTR